MSDQKATLQEPAFPKSLAGCLRFDVVAGFLVFLIALPLCLAIAKASGYPPIAGVVTAVVGGILTPLFSNSAMTIKGPAAGLIVIAIMCVRDFGFTDGKNPAADVHAYQLALGVGFCAALLQILFGLFKAGSLGDFFPSSAVHGLLASIGVIIIAKQLPLALGVNAPSSIEPIPLILSLPQAMLHIHPLAGVVGVASLALMFFYPLFRTPITKAIPVQIVVLAVAVPLGLYLQLGQKSTRWNLSLPSANQGSVHGGHPGIEPTPAGAFLLSMPKSAKQMIDPKEASGLKFPDFTAVTGFGNTGLLLKAWKWVLMFAIIGTLESLLSAKAIDIVDPQKRKTNLNADLLAVGIGNLVAACLGGLPMISEIVRSRANIDNGAKTRLANVFHGLFLLAAAALIPFLLTKIPLAALGAMLVYTGFRLAHPMEFFHVAKIGWEQLTVFVGTIIGVLATDLLWGIVIGVCIELIVNVIHGASPRLLFWPQLEVRQLDEKSCLIAPQQCAVFSNWLAIRSKIASLGLKKNRNIVLDLSATRIVDHTVMEKLAGLRREFQQRGLKLEVVGLDGHDAFSSHPAAARKSVATALAA